MNLVTSKFQHHVFYVEDLARSKEFYTTLFDLQFSALNHPDSSAAMKLAKQEMHFYSFGHYHHDLCLVKQHQLQMDNDSMLHYTMVVRDGKAFDHIRQKAAMMGIPSRLGRMLRSAKMAPTWKVICVQDPDGHWIEVIYKTENA